MTRHRRRPRMLGSCLVAGMLVAVSACGASTTASGKSAAGFPVTFTRCGTTLTFTHRPKILVDQPYAASIVAAAGGNRTGQIVAYTDGGNEPIGPAGVTLATVPQVAKTTSVSKEEIVGVAPNLVVTHGLVAVQPSQLATLGIKTMMVNVCCGSYAAQHGGHLGYQAVYDDVTLLGRLLGTQQYAAASVARMKNTIAQVGHQAKSLPQQSVAVLPGIFSGQLGAYGSASLADTELHTLGMTNTFGDLHRRFVSISAEELINRNPGVIVLGYSPSYNSEGAAQARGDR